MGVFYAVCCFALLSVLVGCLALRRHDGPVGPLPGGPLLRGAMTDAQVGSWTAALEPDVVTVVELQLASTNASRFVGVVLHGGVLYATCDLGFLGYRAPGLLMRAVQRIVQALKHWHKDAERDGRLLLRIAGKRYRFMAKRVTDNRRQAELEAIALAGAKRFFGSLRRSTGAGSIWFFELRPVS